MEGSGGTGKGDGGANEGGNAGGNGGGKGEVNKFGLKMAPKDENGVPE